MMRFFSILLTAMAMVPLLASTAISGDVQRGERLARKWCSTCHLVAPDQGTTSDVAPPFKAIAARRDAAQISGWLIDPHPPMPDPNLTRREIDDLTVYIESLRP
jgi:mono/diheme cytochrome c family protein